MTAQKYANFPERDPKVALGPHINANTMRLLAKLSIGTYEMTVGQQEKVAASAEYARHAINALSRELQIQPTSQETRDYLCAYTTEGQGHKFQIWVGTPFEGGQTSHLVWTKYTDTTAPRKIGIAFRISTAFNTDDMLNLLKQAQKNAVDLQADEPYMLKGNPPPRFVKKTKAEAPAGEAKPAEAEPAAPAGETPAG